MTENKKSTLRYYLFNPYFVLAIGALGVILFAIDTKFDLNTNILLVAWIVCLGYVALITIIMIIIAIYNVLFRRKIKCDTCTHNDAKAAKEMFYKYYCKAMDCQVSGEKKCKYYKPLS